jgi:flagellar protein FlbB
VQLERARLNNNKENAVAKYGIVGIGPRIIVLILFLLAITVAGLIWFDFLGLIDVKDTFAPVLGLVGLKTRTKIEQPDAPDLLDQERMKQQWEAFELRSEELDNRDDSLSIREAELVQMMETVREQEKAIEEKEKSFNDRSKQFDNRNANLRTVSNQYVSMPPSEAVARLVKLPDQDVIDIIRTTDSVAEEEGELSISSRWLQLMPPDRSAVIQRKMLDKPS